MGGNLTMGSVGGVGLGWGKVRRRSIGLRSFSGVRAAQGLFNQVVEYSHTPGRVAGCEIALTWRTSVDGVWGDFTQALWERLVRWSATDCGNPEWPRLSNPGTVIATGPSSWAAYFRAGFHGYRMSDSQISECQTAWYEYIASKSGRPEPEDMVPGPSVTPTPSPSDPDAAARAACTASGGTWDPVGKVCLPSTYGDSGEGMGTGTWILLFAIGALVAGGIYYAATD